MLTPTRIDHVAISAPDFPAAVIQYKQLLGQPAYAEVTEPGRRAALFTLSNTRILLLEAAGVPSTQISALGLATPDAHSCIDQLRAQGLAISALPDQPASLAHGELWALPPEKTRGLTLRIVDRPEAPLPAANSFSAAQVEALDHIVIRSAAPDQARSLFGDTLGMRLALDRELAGTRMLFFRTGGVTLEVIADNHLGAGAADMFYGLAYRVRDLQAAHLRLTAAGFALTDPRPGRKPGTQVFSTRATQAGIPTLFIRDPSRDSP